MDYGYGGGGGDYSTTSYGAKGGAGGGGWMANGSQGGGGGGADADRRAVKDTLRPVTIKQIIDAELPHPDADFRISGAEVSQVTFVGQIRNISQQATNFTYKIDDGTGTIEVKRWIDPDENNAMDQDDNGSSSKPRALQENAYVRVYGTLKAFNTKRHVGARPAGIRPVTDMNEVQMHLLEATAVHLFFEKGPPGGQDGQQQQNGNGVKSEQHTNGAGAMALPAGVSRNAGRVLQCLAQSPQSNEGLHMHDIATRLGLDIGSVQQAGRELESLGKIYSTVDEETWALLDQF